MWLSDGQKIGVGLTALGVLFMFMGVLTFFDAGLLAMGNILFLSGITLTIGIQKTVAFFAQRNKIRGTICFLGGILLVFIKWPLFGIIIEVFGILNLFGDFFPLIFSFLRRLPVIGSILNRPALNNFFDRFSSSSSLPV
ncbi:Got1-domain-containing protein [Radiomyces spectabilis]|uniref:Got1-domain-containing protein n=1 Tax=Radiomyces spectabilis TaxID=64574 RepID=UPI00221EEDEC|nr:Got1-domain-containing protein [Radiomyces spectabilis]KAI8375975.1 Got1-domain-containing protein [Radiomyces spectabilis]